VEVVEELCQELVGQDQKELVKIITLLGMVAVLAVLAVQLPMKLLSLTIPGCQEQVVVEVADGVHQVVLGMAIGVGLRVAEQEGLQEMLELIVQVLRLELQ
jgi:hypothetical protein